MKKIYIAVFILFAVTFNIYSQKTLPVNENKYKLELYNVWGKSHPVAKKLLERLPDLCPELKDKEICGDDCNPAYTVEFYMSDPSVYEYRLQRVFAPPNTNTRNLVQYPLARLMSPEQQANSAANLQANDKWSVYSNYGFQSFLLLRDRNNQIITKLVLVDTNEVWESLRSTSIYTGGTSRYTTPFGYIDNNPDLLYPTREEMVGIAERKILAL